MDRQIIDNVNQCLHKHNISVMKTNERPWGTWDMLLVYPAHPETFFRCRPLGFGYTEETGPAEFIKDFIDGVLPQEQVDAMVGYFGNDLLEEFKQCFVVKEKKKILLTSGETIEG